jgi:hypothetical protein
VRCRGAGAVVVDEQHHAAALAELLVGDGGVLVDVALCVLDVGLESGGLEALLQIRTVVVLPTRRRGGIGKDDAGARRCCVATSFSTAPAA